MALSARTIGALLAVVLLPCAQTSAQSGRDEHSDVTVNPSASEIFPIRQSCFPVLDAKLGVRVNAYESVSGAALGAAPTRRPMPDLERSLVRKLHAAYPGWTFTGPVSLTIEVMVIRERDVTEPGAWTVVTTWAGLGRRESVGWPDCLSEMYSERTDDVDLALSHIVRLMVTGDEIPELGRLRPRWPPN